MFNKIESVVLGLCIISFIFVIGLQMIIQSKDLEVFTDSNNSVYGVPALFENNRDKGVLILEILNDNYEDYKDLEVLINGEPYCRFNGEKEVNLKVYSNDLIEVNGAKYQDKINIKVVGISKNIDLPKLNTVISTSKSIDILGKVTIK